MTKKKNAPPAETAPEPKTGAKAGAAKKAALKITPARLKTFLIDALVSLLAFIAIQGAAVKVYETYTKVRWALDVIGKIDQLGPDFDGLIPPPPNGKNKKTEKDLAGWIRQNLPRAAAAEYRKVGEIFQNTAAKLRSGELDGKREAYADTARELARAVDRAAWTPFMTAIIERPEAVKAGTNAELADLFETAARAIAGEAAEPAASAGEGAPRIG